MLAQENKKLVIHQEKENKKLVELMPNEKGQLKGVEVCTCKKKKKKKKCYIAFSFSAFL